MHRGFAPYFKLTLALLIEYKQLTPFYVPITVIKLLKVHFFFKDNIKRTINILKRCHFVGKSHEK